MTRWAEPSRVEVDRAGLVMDLTGSVLRLPFWFASIMNYLLIIKPFCVFQIDTTMEGKKGRKREKEKSKASKLPFFAKDTDRAESESESVLCGCDPRCLCSLANKAQARKIAKGGPFFLSFWSKCHYLFEWTDRTDWLTDWLTGRRAGGRMTTTWFI